MKDYISIVEKKIIKEYCLASTSKNPYEMAEDLMREPIPFHGPAHHYLVAAVIVTAYCNAKGLEMEKENCLEKAFIRTRNIMPGSCGTYGVCGDVLAASAALGLLILANPMSTHSLKEVNTIASLCQTALARFIGPRCCKQATYQCLHTTVNYMNLELGTSLEFPENPKCHFSNENPDCNRSECPFWIEDQQKQSKFKLRINESLKI